MGPQTDNMRALLKKLAHLEDSMPATLAKKARAEKRVAELQAKPNLTKDEGEEVQAWQGALDSPNTLQASIDLLKRDIQGVAALAAKVK